MICAFNVKKTDRLILVLIVIVVAGVILAGPRTAPSGLFKEVNDSTIGGIEILQGKQLFIDDGLIEALGGGARKQLNQPVKHPNNL